MPAYNEFKESLKSKQNKFAHVYLIHGEDFLYKEIQDALINAILSGSSKSLNCDLMEGTNENIFKGIETLNTFSFLASKKIVVFQDTTLFNSKQKAGDIIKKAKSEYDNKDIKKSAKYLLDFLNVFDLSIEDIKKEDLSKYIQEDFLEDNLDWVDLVVNFCKDNGLNSSNHNNSANAICLAIEKGFPKGNYLIITSGNVDKRLSLYKIIEQNGIVVDCSIPEDKKNQESVLKDRTKDILSKYKKKIDDEAYKMLYDMTGFDLRTFSNNLEKLSVYIGDRINIDVEDVGTLLERTKQDPIYELTNAVSEYNLEKSLFYLNSLLVENYYPLPIIAAISNLIRKILIIKDFIYLNFGSSFKSEGIKFYDFKERILPKIIEYDKKFISHLEKWDSVLEKEQKNIKKKSKSTSELVIAKNPLNAYPAYMLMLKSEKFSIKRLVLALNYLSKADIALKTSSQTPKVILENAVFQIFRQ